MTEPAGVVSTLGFTDDGTTIPRTSPFVAADAASSGTTYQKSGTGEANSSVANSAVTSANTGRRFMARLLRTKRDHCCALYDTENLERLRP
jgi:hypothetical protein